MSHFRNLFNQPAPVGPSTSIQILGDAPAPDSPSDDRGVREQEGRVRERERVLPNGIDRLSELVGNSFPSPVATAGRPDFQTELATITPDTRLVYHSDPRSAAADRYRLLRMRLKGYWKAGKLKKLLVTSALPHDGKSTVVLNLATALAERGKRSVLVVEADLHNPSITKALRLRPRPGLAECLTETVGEPLSAVRRIEPLDFYLLPAGEPPRNATELLQASVFTQLIDKLAPCFDWVLVDSPPVVALSDALSIQQRMDASLIVVRADQTPREAVEHSIELLGKKNILGVVLNGIELRNRPYYQYDGQPAED